MADFSKWPFFKIANFHNFLQKFQRLVLWLVGLIDTKAINVAQPIYIVVRMSDIRAKTGKKCIFCVSGCFCFILMKISQNLYGRMDGSKF